MYKKQYTIEEVYGLVRNNCPFQVVSAYNGKILCKNYNPKKHTNISARVVYDIEPCISVTNQGCYAKAYLRVSVNGWVEYEEEQRKKELQNG